MKKALIALLLLLVPGLAFGQGGMFASDGVSSTALVYGQKVLIAIPGASITVCSIPVTLVNGACTNKVALYSDFGLTKPIANPTTLDANSNYSFYAASTVLQYTVTNKGVSSGPYFVRTPGQGSGGVGTGTTLPPYTQFFTAQTTVTIPGSVHGYRSIGLITACYDNGSPAHLIEPAQSYVNTLTYDVTVLFAAPQSGFCVTNGGTGPKGDLGSVGLPCATGTGTCNMTVPIVAPGFTGSVINEVQVVGLGTNATIQLAITAAGTTGSVQIPASYTGTDTYTNPLGLKVLDLRQMTDELSKLSAFMEPWLAKNGSSSGGNMATLATCIVAGSCTVTGIGNSILGSGGTAYENGVFALLQDSLKARWPTVTWHFKNRYLGGRLSPNPVTGLYPQLPVCPTGSPACATVIAPGSYSYNSGLGFYFPPVSNSIASTGPFTGSDDYPWEKWAGTTGQGWLNSCVLDAPDLFVVLFAMNDEGYSSGAAFTANIKAIIAPMIALPKVPSVLLIAGPNGSISTPGTAYFNSAKYLALDEYADDLRGLARQNNYGLIDAARVLSALRDGTDTALSFFEGDNTTFGTLATNWQSRIVGTSSAAISTDGYTATVTTNNTWQEVRTNLARDVIISGQWDTSNTNTVPAIQWRVPAGGATTGYQAYLINNGSGNGMVNVYSAGGGGTPIGLLAVTGLTSTTSMMVKSVGAEYMVWINGAKVLDGFDFDFIQPGYYGVGITDKNVGTSLTATITAVTMVAGSPLTTCATAIVSRQAAPPCSPAFVSDESLYGYGDTGPRALGGNQINHPSIAGASATYGVAMAPFLDHVATITAQYAAQQFILNSARMWPTVQTFPSGSGFINTANSATEAHWSDQPSGTGIPAGQACWINHKDSGGGSYAVADCVFPGSGAGGFQRYISSSHAIGSEVWTLVQQDQGGTPTFPALKSTTGTRFVCVDTTGKLVSQTTACSGT